MPAVLVATPEPLNSPPRVRLDVTLPAGGVGVSVYITRVGSDGRTVPVRTTAPAVMTGSVWVGYDYEAPYGVVQSYTAQVVYYGSGAAPRLNAITNPNFETNVLGWSTAKYATITRDTTQFWSSVSSMRMDTTAASSTIHTASVSSAPSTSVTVPFYVRGTGTATVRLTFTPSSGPYTTVDGATVALTSSWQRISVTGTSPANSIRATVIILQGSSGSNSMWIDAGLSEESASVGTYFDGDTPDAGGITYAWTGTAGASISTAISAPPVTDTPTDTATVDVTDVWLIHPGVPDLSVKLNLRPLPERVRTVNRGIFTPYGRALPIVVTDGRRKAAQTALATRTDTLEELAALQALTTDTAVLLLQIPATLGLGVTSEYISLGDLTESPVTNVSADQKRLISGPYLVTSRPVGGSQSQRTYADLMAECATYQAVLDLYDTYLDVLAP